MHKSKINYPLLVATLILTGLLLLVAIKRIRVDTDVAASLTKDDGVLDDAVYIFKHLPIRDQIAIDVSLDDEDRVSLLQVAENVEARLIESGLFTKVGMDEIQRVIPQMIGEVMGRLPLLFTAAELEQQVLPLLDAEAIELKFQKLHQSLMRLSSIGQAGLIAKDPLGFKDIKLAELAALAPSEDAQVYKGRLLSSDGRHMLVLAQPSDSGTDTAFARKLTDLIQRVDRAVRDDYPVIQDKIVLTPVGAYRAALDNETIVRTDVNKAILLATLGIAALLLLAFPRPLIGLLALVPAIVGTTLSFFVFSLWRDSISIMALGFGGAVISITVDHGIAYLLFLDRNEKTLGKDASREVWAVGLLAALTSVGAFAVLGFSGFKIFEELGIFSAMGIAFSFLFVHAVFPRIFPVMPPARTTRRLPLRRWVDRLAGWGVKGGVLALVAGLFLVFWARPQFNMDLNAMNTVGASTRAAEALFSRVWGNIFSKIYVMTEADSLAELQEKGDRLLTLLEAAEAEGEISSGFSPARLFPGAVRQQSNLAAWRAFWHPSRIEALRAAMTSPAIRYGFDVNGFDPFFQSLSTGAAPEPTLTVEDAYHSVIGIYHSPDDGQWRQFTGLTAAKQYDGQRFYNRLSNLAKVFDARLFSDKMGGLLFDTFSRMLLIIGISAIALLFLFFADWRLTLICLLPIAFAFAGTLGTLTLMGRTLDIPALMLSIIVLGMGIDYTLFMVRSYQRYQDSRHPNFSLIRMSIFMASVSTLIGFGVLCTAQHNLLHSAGVTSFLGIGFSLAGAFLILPPILDRLFKNTLPLIEDSAPSMAEHRRVRRRYRNMEPYPRLFARFKLQLDPMFKELSEILPPPGNSIHTIIDIGSGYAVPACWLIHRHPGAMVFGIEPVVDRVRVANLALGANGQVVVGSAPQVPHTPHPADAAFMLDMCHFLDDDAFALTLQRLRARLKGDGLFIMRVVLEPRRRYPWTWWIENAKMKIQGAAAFYRSMDQVRELISKHDFDVREIKFSGSQEELAWVVANPKPRWMR